MEAASDLLPGRKQLLARPRLLGRPCIERGFLGRGRGEDAQFTQTRLDLRPPFGEFLDDRGRHPDQFKAPSLAASAQAERALQPGGQLGPEESARRQLVAIESARIERASRAVGAHPDVQQNGVDVELRILCPAGGMLKRGKQQFGAFMDHAIRAAAADDADVGEISDGPAHGGPHVAFDDRSRFGRGLTPGHRDRFGD